jgi:hypothetical protein
VGQPGSHRPWVRAVVVGVSWPRAGRWGCCCACSSTHTVSQLGYIDRRPIRSHSHPKLCYPICYPMNRLCALLFGLPMGYSGEEPRASRSSRSVFTTYSSYNHFISLPLSERYKQLTHLQASCVVPISRHYIKMLQSAIRSKQPKPCQC